MNIQEENSALYSRVQNEREQTLVSVKFLPVDDPVPSIYWWAVSMRGIGGWGGIKWRHTPAMEPARTSF